MVEVIYSGDTKKTETPEEQSRGTLKNIRQIGEISGNTKIYVEDCTMGFLQQQMRRQEQPVIALLGAERTEGEVVSLFISGAILAEKIQVSGSRLVFAADAFTELYDEAAAYFPQSVILGWFLPAYEMIGAYGSVLGEYSRLFLLEEAVDREELFYLWEQKRLIRQSGYYVYYQNNPQMKHYLQQLREAEEAQPLMNQSNEEAQALMDQSNEEPAEAETNEPAGGDAEAEEKSRLKRYNEEQPAEEQQRLTLFLYGVSTVLAIVVLVVGITMISNYERMYEMQETIETIANSIVNGSGGGQNAGESDAEQAAEGETGVPDNAQTESGAVTEETTGDTTEDIATEAAVSDETAQEEAASATEDSVSVDAGTVIVYTVQEGDTLTSISRKFYLSEDYVEKIVEANEDLNENELTVGQKIILP